MALEFIKNLVRNWAGAQASFPLAQLRRGMWVWVDQPDRAPGVGILNAIHSTGECEVHLVNEIGETVQSVTVNPQYIEQATLAQIPEARRPGKEVSDRFGYK